MVSDLLLDIRSTTTCKSFIIKDISVYNDVLTVDCSQVRVLSPGYTVPTYFEVETGFELEMNMVNLGLQVVSSNDCISELPDGVYEIQYSINPNDTLFVDYYYFNNCKLTTRYMQLICDFLNKKCDLSKKEQKAMSESLAKVSQIIRFSKIAAEECGDKEAALDLYEEASELIDKINNGGCTAC